MVGLSEITAPYQTAVNNLLSNSIGKINEDTVLESLRHDELSNAAALEVAFRHAFYNVLATCDIDDEGFSTMWRLLDAINIASDAELCEPGLPFLLIEELLDSQTIHGCRKVFDYLESRRERMIAKHWKAKHLIILRSCNELLRRLSRAEDTVFCGRVFIFLFQSFPLGDKSSVNLRGEYHTDNVTQYDHAVKVAEDSMDVDGQTEGKEDPAAPPKITVEGDEQIETEVLYATFWALQEYFAQPTKLFEGPNLESFKSGLEATLKKFKEVYRDEPRPSAARPLKEGQGVKRKLDSSDGENFNPKYLTSRDLFELEIHDPAFRRHILVQAVIAVDFLLSQAPKAKSKLENLKNKSVIYDFVLNEKDAQWAANMRNEIASYLQQGPEGKFYYRMVDTVLSRDKNWLRWKAESCPPFQLEPIGPESYAEASEGVQRATAPRRIRKTPLGALDVSFLEDRGSDYDPLEKYKDPARWQKPDLNSFRGAIMDAQFDLDMARTDEEKATASEIKSSNVWRALRIGGRFSILDKLDDGNNLDPLFGIESENAADEVTQEEEAEVSVGGLDGSGEEKVTTQEDVEIPGADQEDMDDENYTKGVTVMKKEEKDAKDEGETSQEDERMAGAEQEELPGETAEGVT